MKLARFLILLAAAGALQAQTTVNWDNSGNSMLKGTYYFRQVYYVLGDQNGDLGEAVTIYGTMTFDGNGNYSITASNGAQYIDTAVTPEIGPFTATGTYSIASSGYGFISSPYVSGDTIYGLVSALGVFLGSSTDTGLGYNDMFMASPLASPAPTNASFTGSWTLMDFDFSSGSPATALSTVITIAPDGNGNLNVKGISGYDGSSTAPISQTVSGVKYAFSNGAAVATFPANGTLIIGQKYLYFSPDGNFLFGGSPNTAATPFDFIVGVKATTTPTYSGLYYQAGFDEINGDLDSYFGSFKVVTANNPQTYLGHERLNNYGGVANSSVGGGVSDYTYEATISLANSEYADAYGRYVVGDGGAVEVEAGISPYLGLNVALQAPTLTGSGVYLNPQGILNAASYSPFTTSIAPGELLAMYGTNITDQTMQITGGNPALPTLGNVSVNIGGYPAPVFSINAAAQQVQVLVPNELTAGSIAAIQLTNDKGASNVVTAYVGATAPGVLTLCQCGIGYNPNVTPHYGAIEHIGVGNTRAAVGSIVSDSNPAIPGETVAVYLTGLGTVTPTLADGAVAPFPPSPSTNTISVAIGASGAAATTVFSGVSGGFAGLYQLNMTLPTTSLTAGPNQLAIAGPDTYMQYVLIPISTTSSTTKTANTRVPIGKQPLAVPRTPGKVSPSLRAKQNR